MDEQTYKKLKARVDLARQTRDRATGQLDGVMDRLKKEFDCSTIEEAEKMAAKLEREATVAERAFDEAAKKFEAEWHDNLEK